MGENKSVTKGNRMNSAILNADLPIALRMKRANKRGWRIDRKDNIRFLVEGMKAYREYAALTPWETTMQAQKPALFTSFANQSTELMFSAFALREELDNLDDKGHYPGIGNDRQRLQTTITYLEDTASIRDEEAALMGFTKGKLVSVVELAKQKELEGYENLPNRRDMQKATFPREDVVRLLVETLNLSAAQVANFLQTVPRLTPPPSTRTRTTPRRQSPPRSPVGSPTSVTVMDSPDGAGSSGLPVIAEDYGIQGYGSNIEIAD